MKVTGSTQNGYRINPSNFSVEVPEGATLRFDASQSTLTVSDKAGSVLVAIKQVAWYSVDAVGIDWVLPTPTATVVQA